MDDKKIELCNVATPTDVTADGGGITLKGSSDKTIVWSNANDRWDVNQAWNLTSGYFQIAGTEVLSNNTLGAGVTASSLTTVGTLNTLTVAGNVTINGTGSLKVATGTQAQRPGTATAGMLRFNTDTNGYEGYNGSVWGGLGGGNPWATKTANYTAVAGDRLFVDTSSSAITITLPASPAAGDQVTIMDLAGSFDTNNLTVARNGQDIMNIAQDLTVNTEHAAFALVFTGATNGWKQLNLA